MDTSFELMKKVWHKKRLSNSYLFAFFGVGRVLIIIQFGFYLWNRYISLYLPTAGTSSARLKAKKNVPSFGTNKLLLE